MNISLSKQLEKWVRDRVKSGDFETASEVIRDAIRIAKEHDRVRREAVKRLQREVQIGVREADRGLGHPFDSAAMRRDVRRRAAELRAARKRSA